LLLSRLSRIHLNIKCRSDILLLFPG
jgi:hypothetical protein